MTDTISPELRAVLRRLKLSPVLDSLPERLVLARQQKMTHQDFMELVLSDEAARRDSQAATLRAGKAGLDPDMKLERWDHTAKVIFDQMLLNEFVSLRFLEANAHIAIVGPVGVGKTFLGHAIGHVACRAGHPVVAVRADKMLKRLKHARLDNTYEAELRRLVSVSLLIVDDFGLDAMDATESRDAYEILTERHRAGSMVVTSNRGPDEWLATFADPVRAQSAIDRFCGNSYDLVIEGESYRPRQKPRLPGAKTPSSDPTPQRSRAETDLTSNTRHPRASNGHRATPGPQKQHRTGHGLKEKEDGA
jgi:DNA replication protein DnaC